MGSARALAARASTSPLSRGTRRSATTTKSCGNPAEPGREKFYAEFGRDYRIYWDSNYSQCTDINMYPNEMCHELFRFIHAGSTNDQIFDGNAIGQIQAHIRVFEVAIKPKKGAIMIVSGLFLQKLVRQRGRDTYIKRIDACNEVR